MWAVAALENGELATGCHDGVIRLFTRDVNKVAPPEVGFYEHISAHHNLHRGALADLCVIQNVGLDEYGIV
jgi:hypothetical protein